MRLSYHSLKESLRTLYQRVDGTHAGRFTLHLYQRYSDTNVHFLAAALAYYAVFSLGPLLLLLASGLAVLLGNRPELAAQYRQSLVGLVAQLMPLQEDSAELIEQSFDIALGLLQEGALLRSAISLLILLWASSNFFTALQLALENIFQSPNPRGYWRKRLVGMISVLIVGIVIAIEVIGGVLVSYLQQLITLTRQTIEWLSGQSIPALRIHIGFLNEALRAAIAASAFTLCFRLLPRRVSSWFGAFVGALVSTISIILMRQLFTQFLNVEQFNLIYGIITSLLLVLLWLYVSMLLFFLGALVAAELSQNSSSHDSAEERTPSQKPPTQDPVTPPHAH